MLPGVVMMIMPVVMVIMPVVVMMTIRADPLDMVMMAFLRRTDGALMANNLLAITA